MADTVYQYLYNQVAAAVDDNMTNFLKKVCAYIETPLGIAMTLYVVIYGVMIIRGQVQEPIGDFIRKCFKLAVIWYVAANPDIFKLYFSDVFLKLIPNAVTEAVTGLKPATGGGSLDTFTTYGYDLAEFVLNQGWWFDIGKYLLALIILIATTLAGCAAFFIMVMAAIILATLLLLGPIFVCLLLFEVTARWFWSWLSNLVTMVLVQVLLIALLTLVISVTAYLYKEARGGPQTASAAFNVVTIYIITFFIFIRLPDISSSIGGGISFSMKEFGSTLKSGFKGVGGVAGKAISAVQSRLGRLHNSSKDKENHNKGTESNNQNKNIPTNNSSTSNTSSSSDSRLMSGKGDKIYSNSGGVGSTAYRAANARGAGDAASIANVGLNSSTISQVSTASKVAGAPDSRQQQRSQAERRAKQNMEQNQPSMASITSNSGSEPSSTTSSSSTTTGDSGSKSAPTTAPSSPPSSTSSSTNSQGGGP